MKTSLFLAALAAFTTAGATENPLWMRYCSISPDGSTIAFCYKGDIYTVPSTGGNARQLTTNPAHDTHPIWSPDGQQIAFASSRQGSMDIYIVSKDGGIPKRLTTHSGNETPVTFSDATHILFKANLMPDATDLSFPSAQFPQVYEINTQGDVPNSIPLFLWKTSVLHKMVRPYYITTRKDTKTPGENIILPPLHATFG